MINRAVVLHTPRSELCYATPGAGVHLRLRAARGELKRVTVVYGDPFVWEVSDEAMTLTFSGEHYDWFEVDINVESRRYGYHFLLDSGDEKLRYAETGFSTDLGPGEYAQESFRYEYVYDQDVHDTPEWVRDSVLYQIMVDRFRKTGPDRAGLQAWDAPPTGEDPKGGTLQGVIQSLDYLEDLGVGAIYLTPIFKGHTAHKYDTIDYFEVDPDFGTKDDLVNLVTGAHDRGIRVILDAVFNHCGYGFAPFQDVVKNQEKSKYVNWFSIRKFPIDVDENMELVAERGYDTWYRAQDGSLNIQYDMFAFAPTMPRLRTENPEVMKYLLDATTYWIKEADIDGWRLDVADEVSPEFWREFRKAVKAVKPDAYIVGEVWYDSRFWLAGDRFDAVMNYPVRTACIDFFANKTIDSSTFADRLSDHLMRYSWPVNEVMMNLIDSHDVGRLISLSGSRDAVILSHAFVMTFVGAPQICYGTEVGLGGDNMVSAREGMIWDESKWDRPLRGAIRELAHIRNANIALKRGSVSWVDMADPDLVAYSRVCPEQSVVVFLNRAQVAKTAPLPEGFRNGYDVRQQTHCNGDATVPGCGFTLIVAPQGTT